MDAEVQNGRAWSEIPTFIIYAAARGIDDGLSFELARRELCWLVKDRLTGQGRQQKGWSFVRAQVEPLGTSPLEDCRSIGVKTGQPDLDVIAQFEESASATLFRIALQGPIRIEHLVTRLALADQLLILHSPRIDMPHKAAAVKCDRTFWADNFARAWSERQDPVELALFNIASPYEDGLVVNFETQTLIDVSHHELHKLPVAFTPSTPGRKLPITCVFDAIAADKAENTQSLTQQIRNLASLLLPGNSRTETSMRDLEIETGALTGAMGLVALRDSEDPKQVTQLIGRIVEVADDYDLGLHLLLRKKETADGQGTSFYLGFRKHPKDPVVKEMERPFDGAFEARRLRLVEWVRNHIRGHKGPGGTQDTIIHVTQQGWTVVLIRPGYKDCEDFVAEIRPPHDDVEGLRFDLKDPRPIFDKVFDEAERHFECSKTGVAFADAVWSIWNARNDLEEILEESLPKLHDCTSELHYDTEAFLWLIHFLFIVEDMNYRFWYHPPLRGLLTRKQGRGMPMNCLLHVMAGNPKIHEETPGSLIPRPTSFSGPGHLKEWFESHVLHPSQQIRS